MANVEDSFNEEKARLLADFEREKQQMRERSEAELRLVLESARKDGEEALRVRESELRDEFDADKHGLEIKWVSERNALERAFAEDKMEMMARLQVCRRFSIC